MGETGDDSFLAMQDDCRAAFADAAREWGWQRLYMADRPQEVNIGEAVAAIEAAMLAPLASPAPPAPPAPPALSPGATRR
jgi:hypothetical protein